MGPYTKDIKKAEDDIKSAAKKVKELAGIKESDTGLGPPSLWDLAADKQMMQEEQALQVARCTKIINPGTEDAKYVINIKQVRRTDAGPCPVASAPIPDPVAVVCQIAKFVVALGEKVAPSDIEEGMRVGTDRTKHQIQIPLPPKIDPTVTMMTVEEKPDVTYNEVGGNKEQIEKMREVVELPMLHPVRTHPPLFSLLASCPSLLRGCTAQGVFLRLPTSTNAVVCRCSCQERFVALGIDPPKGVLLYGPPGTGKTLLARAVANRTDACFIRVIGSELVQKYVGEGARMVRELFQMARSKKA